MSLRALEGSLDGVLLWMVGAKPRTQQLIHSFEIRFDDGSLAAGNAPPNAPSRGEVILGEASKGYDRQIGSHRGHGDMRVIIDYQFVVDLVGKNNQVMAAREFGNLFKRSARVD